MKTIEIKCGFCRDTAKFNGMFPTLPIAAGQYAPDTIYTSNTDAIHFDSGFSVVYVSFINRCSNCANESRFAVALSTFNPDGVSNEDELAKAFLTGRFEPELDSIIKHDWFIPHGVKGEILGRRSLLTTTIAFPLAKCRVNDDDELDTTIDQACSSLEWVIKEQIG